MKDEDVLSNAHSMLACRRLGAQNAAMRSFQSGTDPLSDVLATFTLQRVVSARFEAAGSFALRMPAYDHVKIGASIAGAFDLQIAGSSEIVRIEKGDCYLLTDGHAYRTSSGDTDPCADADGAALFAANKGSDGVVRWGSGVATTIAVGARFVFDTIGLEWLRSSVPNLIHITACMPAAAPIRATLALLAAEAVDSGPGQALISERLSDVLLVQALRAHLQSGGTTVGWLSGLSDPRIARALENFHGSLGEVWSVERLAKAGGMSRSAFSDRFLASVGMTPMAYVSAWRMQRIRHALATSDRTFADIAAQNGFLSRTAASRSFRRQFGIAPLDVRR